MNPDSDQMTNMLVESLMATGSFMNDSGVGWSSFVSHLFARHVR